ncbi:hypothetical protein BCR33DRAFT_714379 [Rhizoclosmatium globosum]|uniref:Fungal calcium binding protein domain-containing protein n=1 Tax=Rhizoclosmatium globosum TaxID=329046 RepID=A0A1Y2CP78_9FUNG|nr:hypothetical protein BCR33DRAFT_714379 [Rhizoclosmatium globosum]|eukprot:ORY48644.1 hypothetical protein BCR33DRAFT_714379 [Rhizoclosmatium globosum]
MQFALTLAFLASIALAQVPTGTSGMPSDACLNGLTSFVTVASNCKIDIMALASSNATFTPTKTKSLASQGAISTGSYAAAAVVGAMFL